MQSFKTLLVMYNASRPRRLLLRVCVFTLSQTTFFFLISGSSSFQVLSLIDSHCMFSKRPFYDFTKIRWSSF